MKPGYAHSLLACYIALCTLPVTASQITDQAPSNSHKVPRWFNPEVFPVTSSDDSPYELQFDLTFAGNGGEVIEVETCRQLSSVAETDVADREYARWDLFKVHCEAAMRFHHAPSSSISYWPTEFDLPLIKTFPATAIPYLGGQGLDGRTGTLGTSASDVQLIETSSMSVKINLEETVINYVPIVRGDFNRDGYEDILVSMSWHIPGTFGGGTDWVALTRTSADAPPMLLWRK